MSLLESLQSPFQVRQRMNREDYELFYYNDSRLRHVDLHTHDYFEFYFFVEGDVTQEIGGQQYVLRPGDVVIIPPGVPHQTFIRRHPYRRFVLWFSSDYIHTLKNFSEDYMMLIHQVEEKRQYLFHFDYFTFNALQSQLRLILEENNTRRFGYQSLIIGTLSNLLIQLGRIVYERRHPLSGSGESPLYERMVLYIEGHLEEDLSLDRLAEVFFSSKFHLSHLFKEKSGISVHSYISKKRLAAACDAIRSGQEAAAAGEASGFSDYSVFYRAFKKEYGISPREYARSQALV